MSKSNSIDLTTLAFVASELACRDADLDAAEIVLRAVSNRVAELGVSDPLLLNLLLLPAVPEQTTRLQETARHRLSRTRSEFVRDVALEVGRSDSDRGAIRIGLFALSLGVTARR